MMDARQPKNLEISLLKTIPVPFGNILSSSPSFTMAASVLPGPLHPAVPLVIASCRSAEMLAAKTAKQLSILSSNISTFSGVDTSFSDSETCVRLPADVTGATVFLFQSLYDPASPRPVDQNYMALWVAARALKEWGASSVIAVIPYLAYARQNRPTQGQREPVTARLMADLSAAAGIDRLITFRPHTDQIAAFYRDGAVEQVDSVAFFASIFSPFQGQKDVILVAPDAGAMPFVTAVGRALGVKCAVGSKYRPRAEECVLSEIIGDFTGIRTALVLDDMISSGGTVYKLIRSLYTEKGIEQIYLGVAHNLCLLPARDRLLDLYEHFGLKGVIVTNSIPQTEDFTTLPFIEVIDLSDILATKICQVLSKSEDPISLG